jgi:hypothetical protein
MYALILGYFIWVVLPCWLWNCKEWREKEDKDALCLWLKLIGDKLTNFIF